MKMKAEYYDVIRNPIVTEKATMASASNAVVFEVSMSSNKIVIKEIKGSERVVEKVVYQTKIKEVEKIVEVPTI